MMITNVFVISFLFVSVISNTNDKNIQQLLHKLVEFNTNVQTLSNLYKTKHQPSSKLIADVKSADETSQQQTQDRFNVRPVSFSSSNLLMKNNYQGLVGISHETDKE